MISITLDNIGKRYGAEWIFRGLSTGFHSGNIYAVKGPNGSGKSTLLKILSGYLTCSQGEVSYRVSNVNVSRDDIYLYMAYTAPYLDLIDSFTVREMISFQIELGKMQDNISPEHILENSYLGKASGFQLWELSSGMLQRLKLALAIYSNAPVLLIDEPGTNLDETAMQWYLDALNENKGSRLVVIASNDQRDFAGAEDIIDITSFKHRP